VDWQGGVCHQARGFEVARPMPAEEVMAWVIARELTEDSASPGSDAKGHHSSDGSSAVVLVLPGRNLRPARSKCVSS